MLAGINLILKTTETLDRGQVKELLQKLERCRNQENNPKSDAYVDTAVGARVRGLRDLETISPRALKADVAL